MSQAVEFTTQRLADMNTELLTFYEQSQGRSYANIPRTLNSTDLPACVVFPGALISRTVNAGAPRLVEETRNYDMIYFFAVAALGDADSSQIAVAPWFDRIPEWFLARPGLELDNDALAEQVAFNSAIGIDGGYEVIEYPTGTNKTTPFAAMRQPIQVTTIRKVVMRD